MLTLFWAVFALLLSFPLSVLAHSGKTDSNGGHHDSSTGSYHYHHGYPAHQHTNGICPYDYDDQTDHPSKKTSSSHSPDPDDSEGSDSEGPSLGLILLTIPIVFFVLSKA